MAGHVRIRPSNTQFDPFRRSVPDRVQHEHLLIENMMEHGVSGRNSLCRKGWKNGSHGSHGPLDDKNHDLPRFTYIRNIKRCDEFHSYVKLPKVQFAEFAPKKTLPLENTSHQHGSAISNPLKTPNRSGPSRLGRPGFISIKFPEIRARSSPCTLW